MTAPQPKKRRPRGDGSIYFDEATGRWVGLLDLGRDVKGDRVRRKATGRTQAEVAKKLRTFQAEQRAGLDRHVRPSVEAVIREWLVKAAPSRREASTMERLTRRLEDHVIPGVGHHRIDALRAEHVEDWLRSEAMAGKRGQSRRTIEDYRGDLRQVLNWAKRRRLVDWNAAAEAEIPSESRQPTEKRTLDEAGAARLLGELAGDRMGPYFTALLLLGLRPGEADALSWRDVDLDRGAVVIAHAMQRGDGGRVLGIADTKTKKGRTLQLPAVALEALRRQRVQQARERLLAGPAWAAEERWADLVFTTEIGTPMHPSNVRRSFAAVCKRAEVEALTPYELRHSAASLLVAAGVAPFEVADMLGHRDLRMLERHYRHRTTPLVSGHTNVMDRIAAGGA